jgi:hypothetical protein
MTLSNLSITKRIWITESPSRSYLNTGQYILCKPLVTLNALPVFKWSLNLSFTWWQTILMRSFFLEVQSWLAAWKSALAELRSGALGISLFLGGSNFHFRVEKVRVLWRPRAKKARLITRRRWGDRTDLEMSVDELFHRRWEIFGRILEQKKKGPVKNSEALRWANRFGKVRRRFFFIIEGKLLAEFWKKNKTG